MTVTTVRKRKRKAALRGSVLLRGTLALLVTALVFRVIVLTGAAAYIDDALTAAAANPDFVQTVLSTELSGPTASWPTWTELLVGQSSSLYSTHAGEGEDWENQPLETPAPPSAAPTPYQTPFPGYGSDRYNGAFGEGVPVTPSPSPTPSAAPTDDPSYSPAPEGFVQGQATEITFKPKGDESYAASGIVYVKNQTGLSLDVSALLKTDINLGFEKDKPQILVIHTHGSESFLPDKDHYYVPTDTERTEDPRFNVIRLGDELTTLLEQQGLHVFHDRSIFDEPTYSGSYTRALEVIKKVLKDNPSIKMVIDLHRDSIQTSAGVVYKPVATVDGVKVAQMMMVIGTSDLGLDHPNWKKNMTLAVHLQQQLETKYPAIMRPIDMRKERFNQHATAGSMILEVGSSGNTLDEALASVRLFAETVGPVLAEMVAQ